MKEIEYNVLNAEKLGEEEHKKFVKERLMKNSNLFDPIHKLKLKTMANSSKKIKLKTSTNKEVELKQQGNIAFQLLVKSQHFGMNLDLNEVMKYQLTPIPYSLGTIDGFLNKTNKAKGVEYLTKNIEDTVSFPNKEKMIIIDGNAAYYTLTNLPHTFGEVCQKIFYTLPKGSDITFSTDMYKAHSIKSIERERRGSGDKLILLSGPSMKRPPDWKVYSYC